MKPMEKIIEKDLVKVIGFFIFLIILFLVASYFFNRVGKFDYQGLSFTEEKFGELDVFHYYYTFKSPVTGQIIKYNLYLRNDPRDNDVPVEGDPIEFRAGKIVYVSLDATDLAECPTSNLAAAALGSFLSGNQMTVKSGTTDITEAAVYGNDLIRDYITCENKPGNVVVEISRGEETKIVINGKCHKIIVGPKCDIVEAVEKYEVQALLDAKAS